MTVPVRVRIAGENVGRDVASQVPLTRAVVQREVDRGQIARMIAIARADHDRHDIAGLHRDLFQWSDGNRLWPLAGAGGKALPRIAATQFERPSHTIAAFRMRVLDGRADAKGCLPGLRHPTATESVGLGCTAMLCGRMLPGIRTG